MEITRGALVERRAAMVADINRLKAEDARLAADINAIGGAIQDIDYWLEQFDKQEQPEPESEQAEAKK
jgi:hypothetical protein